MYNIVRKDNYYFFDSNKYEFCDKCRKFYTQQRPCYCKNSGNK